MYAQYPSFLKYGRLVFLVHEIFVWLHLFHNEEIAGFDNVQRVLGDRKREFFQLCQQKARTYLCFVNDIFNDWSNHALRLDMPNLHILLKLVVHTLLIYSHCRHVSDPLFENKYQPLKKIFLSYHHANNAEWVIQCDATRFWKNRISQLLFSFSDTSIIYGNYLVLRCDSSNLRNDASGQSLWCNIRNS